MAGAPSESFLWCLRLHAYVLLVLSSFFPFALHVQSPQCSWLSKWCSKTVLVRHIFNSWKVPSNQILSIHEVHHVNKTTLSLSSIFLLLQRQLVAIAIPFFSLNCCVIQSCTGISAGKRTIWRGGKNAGRIGAKRRIARGGKRSCTIDRQVAKKEANNNHTICLPKIFLDYGHIMATPINQAHYWLVPWTPGSLMPNSYIT